MQVKICRDCCYWEKDEQFAHIGRCMCKGRMIHPVGPTGKWIVEFCWYETQFNYGCVNWSDEPEEEEI